MYKAFSKGFHRSFAASREDHQAPTFTQISLRDDHFRDPLLVLNALSDNGAVVGKAFWLRSLLQYEMSIGTTKSKVVDRCSPYLSPRPQYLLSRDLNSSKYEITEN